MRSDPLVTCLICSDAKQEPLVDVCNCSAGRDVHASCVEKWLLTLPISDREQCAICKTTYNSVKTFVVCARRMAIPRVLEHPFCQIFGAGLILFLWWLFLQYLQTLPPDPNPFPRGPYLVDLIVAIRTCDEEVLKWRFIMTFCFLWLFIIAEKTGAIDCIVEFLVLLRPHMTTTLLEIRDKSLD
jgi:hypothetical protein